MCNIRDTVKLDSILFYFPPPRLDCHLSVIEVTAMAGHSLTLLPSVVEFKLKSAWWSELGWNLTRLGSTDDDENATLRSLAQCNSYYRCSYYFQQVSCGDLACLLRVACSSRERAPATERHQTSVRWVSNLLCPNPNPSYNICIIINYSFIGRLCVYLNLKICFVYFDRSSIA